jgi:hypothetical protein
MLPLTGIEIHLSNWKRSLCKSIDYPAFDNPEPVLLPDKLGEKIFDFSGFVCYETTFVLNEQESLTLEISNAIGNVEVFMNGETLGIRSKPPYHYDLSSPAWLGKNHLAIEVAVITERVRMAVGESQLCIIGNVRHYSNCDKHNVN